MTDHNVMVPATAELDDELFNQAAAEVDDELFQQSLLEVDAELDSKEASRGGTGFLSEVANAWDASGAAIGNLALAGKDAIFGEPAQEAKSQFRRDWEAESRLVNNTPGGQAWNSVGAGMGNAAIELKDFKDSIAGEPEDKSQFRKDWEAKADSLKTASATNAVTMGVSQFTTGLIGFGKLLAPIKAVQKVRQAGKAGSAVYEIGKGAITAATVIDPHEERLSDLVQQYDFLQNPVSEFLASDPEDSAVMGRFKNALEGAGMDLAVVGAFGASLKAIKFLREGDEAKALKVLAQEEHAVRANREAFGMDFGPVDVQPQASSTKQSLERPVVAPIAEGINLPTNAVEAPNGQSGVIQQGLDASASTGAVERIPSPLIEEVSDDAVASILKDTQSDLAAIEKYGSRAAATDAGQMLSPKSRLPWHKLRASEEVETFVEQAARTLETRFTGMKGGAILKDAKVAELVQRRAEMFNEDPALVMGEISKAGEGAASMVADMESSYLIGNRMMQESYETAFKIRNGMLDEWGGDAAKATAELKARLSAASDVIGSAQSITSNSARTMRRMRGDFKIKAEDIAKIKDLDGNKLVDLVYSSKGEPKQLLQAANPGFLQRATSELSYLYANNLLWLYPTHAINLTSNTYMMIARPTEKILGSLALGSKGAPIRQQAMKEYLYTVNSLGDAWTGLVDAFKKGDSILSPHNTEFFEAGATGVSAKPLKWKEVRDIWDVFENGLNALNYHNIIGLPTRSLGAADEFFKTLRYRAVVQAEAASKANGLGLGGKDLKDYIQREMEKAIDPISGRATNRKALEEAQASSFQQELLPGTIGATVRNVRAAHPSLAFVLPFIKTPINVLRYSVKMTPILNLAQKEFRQALSGAKGAESQAQAAGQMALGSMFMGLGAALKLEGKITGAGPSNVQEKQKLQATGWQPYALVFDEEDGTKTYFKLGRLDPISMPLTMIADLVDMMEMRGGKNEEDLTAGLSAAALSIAKNFSDRTLLQNVNQLLQALTEPKGKGSKFLGTMAGNLTPASSLIRGVNPDPYSREARGFIDSMMKNWPGYSETLPPVRDVFGEPEWKRIGLSTSQDDDMVEAEHNRIILETGKGINKPDPSRNGLDFRDIRTTDGRTAYDRLQELSGQLPGRPSLKTLLAQTIRKETYQDMPDGESGVKGTKSWALSGIVSDYREAAVKTLLRENPQLRMQLHNRERDAKGAYLKNRKERQERQPGAVELLESLGAVRQ